MARRCQVKVTFWVVLRCTINVFLAVVMSLSGEYLEYTTRNGLEALDPLQAGASCTILMAAPKATTHFLLKKKRSGLARLVMCCLALCLSCMVAAGILGCLKLVSKLIGSEEPVVVIVGLQNIQT